MLSMRRWLRFEHNHLYTGRKEYDWHRFSKGALHSDSRDLFGLTRHPMDEVLQVGVLEMRFDSFNRKSSS